MQICQLSQDEAKQYGAPWRFARLRELERLSRKLGASASQEPWVDQLLDLVKGGQYTMLKLNFVFLEQFLRCQVKNPALQANNSVTAGGLENMGSDFC